MLLLTLICGLDQASVWIAETSLRRLVLLIEYVDIVVQICFLIIQLVHFPL